MKRDHFEHQLVPSPTTAAHEEKILRRLFHGYPGGLAARLPNGAMLTPGAHAPEFTLVFKHPGVIRDLVLSQDPLQLAEPYFSDRVDFEGDIYRVLAVKDHFQSLTLREWVRRLEARKEEALQQVSEAVFRVWRLYMAACAIEFENGEVGVHQILASKRDRGLWPVPLTRRDLYI